MFPQPKKWPKYLGLAIVAIFVFKNPIAAAHMATHLAGVVSQGASALSKFASALHLS
jgi:hypothetical protein